MMGSVVPVDYSTIYCWVQKYTLESEKQLHRHQPRSTSWRVDETM
ncbi:hypothetical protein B3286c1_1012 [Brucella vulpis]|nr:hypothetical protein BF3285c1_1013 [Brucella vulpis]CUW49835.1 hypothetical protein B3286c1_1012 [Brucella vulpis]